MKNRNLFIILPLVCCSLLGVFGTSHSDVQKAENKSDIAQSNISRVSEGSVDMLHMISFLIDKQEHYPISDSFIETYQQTSGGYIDFAKATGHLVDKSQHEPNQKWHFFESWLCQSFKDGTMSSLDLDAKSKVYTSLLCPELLLWIYEASGVATSKVEAARDVAVQGKIAGTNVSTIASNMRKCVSWDDIYQNIPKDPLGEESGSLNPSVNMLQFASFLIDKQEHYSISDPFIVSHQPASGGYIDFASSVGHTIDKQNHEPNQKWHFFEAMFINGLKEGAFTLGSDAEEKAYRGITSPELLLWMFEAAGVESSKVNNAKVVAENGLSEGEEASVIADEMRECVSWNDIIRIKSTTTSPTRTTITVGGDDKVISAVPDPYFSTDAVAWSISEGSDCISITPNGKEVTIHPIKDGKAKVRASYTESIIAECSVTIKASAATTITGLPSSISLKIGETATLNPKLSTGDGTFTFASSNDSIATASSAGIITAIAEGSTNIVVTNIENTSITATVPISVSTNQGGGDEPVSGTVYSTCLFGPTHNSKSVNNYTSTWSATNNSCTWDIVRFNNYSNRWDYVKTGSSASDLVGSITTNSSYSVAISKVVLTLGAITASKVNSIILKYGSSLSALTNSVSIDAKTVGDHEFIISNPEADQYYQLEFNCVTGSSNGFVQVNKIEFYRQMSAKDLSDVYANSFNAKMQEKCVAPYDVMKQSDWTELSNTYSSLSSDSKQVFIDQYALYVSSSSEEIYTQLFNTYKYIIEIKYGWSDFMDVGLTPKPANNFMFGNNNSNDGISIIIVIATMVLFTGIVSLLLFERKKHLYK